MPAVRLPFQSRPNKMCWPLENRPKEQNNSRHRSFVQLAAHAAVNAAPAEPAYIFLIELLSILADEPGLSFSRLQKNKSRPNQIERQLPSRNHPKNKKRGSPAYQDSPFSPSAFGTAKERRKQTSEMTASRMKIE